MTKKKYYYLFTSILIFNILGVLFDTFFSQKLWDKILFKTVKHHSFFDSAFFELFYFHFFELCLLGIFFSLLFLIVTSLLPDSEQSEQLAEDKTIAKNFIILSGIVEKKRHSFRVSVSDSLYKAIKYHAVERNFTTAGAAEDMLEKSLLKLPIIYDLYADEETNTINNIKYYLEEIKKNVKDSVLMIHDESYGHAAEDFISFLEPLSSNPMSCFNSGNLARIEKEFMNILLAAYDAGLRAGISLFPLEESYFYRFLFLCKRGIKNENTKTN